MMDVRGNNDFDQMKKENLLPVNVRIFSIIIFQGFLSPTNNSISFKMGNIDTPLLPPGRSIR
jgi:hypothetical protein